MDTATYEPQNFQIPTFFATPNFSNPLESMGLVYLPTSGWCFGYIQVNNGIPYMDGMGMASEKKRLLESLDTKKFKADIQPFHNDAT